MYNFRPVSLLVSSLLLASSGSALAAIIVADSFAVNEGGADYVVDTRLVNQSATVGTTGYTGPWVSANTQALRVANQTLAHPFSPAAGLSGAVIAFSNDSGSAARRVNRPINYTPTDGTYYFSAIFRKNQATTTRDLVVGLGPNESYSTPWSSTQGTFMGIWNGAFQFTPGGGAFTELVSETNFAEFDNYLGVMEITYSSSGADSVNVSVYDGGGNELANQLFTGLNMDDDTRLVVGTEGYAPYVLVDEILFGTELNDVFLSNVKVVPEPGTAGLLLASIAVLRGFRKQRMFAG